MDGFRDAIGGGGGFAPGIEGLGGIPGVGRSFDAAELITLSERVWSMLAIRGRKAGGLGAALGGGREGCSDSGSESAPVATPPVVFRNLGIPPAKSPPS